MLYVLFVDRDMFGVFKGTYDSIGFGRVTRSRMVVLPVRIGAERASGPPAAFFASAAGEEPLACWPGSSEAGSGCAP